MTDEYGISSDRSQRGGLKKCEKDLRHIGIPEGPISDGVKFRDKSWKAVNVLRWKSEPKRRRGHLKRYWEAGTRTMK